VAEIESVEIVDQEHIGGLQDGCESVGHGVSGSCFEGAGV
jgi:hypothetical protein